MNVVVAVIAPVVPDHVPMIVPPIVANRLEIVMEQLVPFGVGQIYLARIVREVVVAIALPIVPARAVVIVPLIVEIVLEHACPTVLVPPIQEKYLLFYSFFNTIYSNISLLYRSFYMAGIMLCIYAVAIIVSVVIIANGCIKLFKDDDWRRNIIWWPKPKNRRNVDIEGALDRWHDRELRFQQEEAAKKKAASGPSMSKYLNSRITLQDVQDYVKICPPLGQAQCTGCHIAACKDDCNHTCGGKCSTVCNSSCHFACVGVCGGGCSGEASALGVDMF